MPPTATNITVAPSRRSSSARAAAAATSTPSSSISAWLPSATSAPSTVPTTPLPVTERKSPAAPSVEPALLGGGDDGGRQRVLARPLEGRREAQQLGLGPVAQGDDRGDLGPALGQRPGLVDTSVSTFSSRSSASAFLISTPSPAPRPTPTMIDIGVARPSAHGQAMISTDTAAIRP